MNGEIGALKKLPFNKWVTGVINNRSGVITLPKIGRGSLCSHPHSFCSSLAMTEVARFSLTCAIEIMASLWGNNLKGSRDWRFGDAGVFTMTAACQGLPALALPQYTAWICLVYSRGTPGKFQQRLPPPPGSTSRYQLEAPPGAATHRLSPRAPPPSDRRSPIPASDLPSFQSSLFRRVYFLVFPIQKSGTVARWGLWHVMTCLSRCNVLQPSLKITGTECKKCPKLYYSCYGCNAA